jgi:hypothetical protein
VAASRIFQKGLPPLKKRAKKPENEKQATYRGCELLRHRRSSAKSSAPFEDMPYISFSVQLPARQGSQGECLDTWLGVSDV